MNKEDELSLLLGMAHGLANSFNHEFGPGQREIMDRIERGIDKLFYSNSCVSEEIV